MAPRNRLSLSIKALALTGKVWQVWPEAAVIELDVRPCEAMVTDAGRQPDAFFYGLQPRWLSGDRLYRVYVSDKMLVGAYVAGPLYDEQSAALQLQQLGPFLRPLVRRRLAQRLERETLYDSLDPFAQSLLDFDPLNFQVLRSDIARTRFRRNRSLWTRYNVGVVELELLDGTTRRLILVGDQQPDDVLRLMQAFDAAIEITGKPNPLPRPKPMSPAGQRFLFVLLAGLLIGFAALFSYVAVAGVAHNPTLLPVAVVNVLAAGWCLVQAWRVPNNRPKPVEE
jgi:hypothetical protein